MLRDDIEKYKNYPDNWSQADTSMLAWRLIAAVEAMDLALKLAEARLCKGPAREAVREAIRKMEK